MPEKTPPSLPRRMLRRARRRMNDMRTDRASRRLLAAPFRLVVVCGQKRSGNHLFLNWYLSQCPGPSVHYNHIHPDQWPTERHYRSFRPGRLDSVPTLVLSYEDRDLDAVFSGALSGFMGEHAGRITDRHLALVMRDPKNLIASRFRKWPEEHAEPARQERIVELLTAYADPALSSPETLHGMPFTPVLFDALLASERYRAELSDRLRIDRGDRGLDEVTTYGHGSSFDGTAKKGTEMSVGSRWQNYRNDPVFRALMKRPELQRIDASYAGALESILPPPGESFESGG